MRKVLLAAVFLLSTVFSFAQEWRDVGSYGLFPSAETPGITVTANGKVYIAFKDMSSGVAAYEWNGEEWIDMGSIFPTVVEDVRITSADNEVYVGLYDVDGGEYRVFHRDGTGWTQIGDLTPMNYTAGKIDLTAVDGGLHSLKVFFRDEVTGDAMIWEFSGSTWTPYGATDFLAYSAPADLGQMLINDNEGDVFVCTSEDAMGSAPLTFYHFNAGFWTNYTYETAPEIVYSTIAYSVDSYNGFNPYLAVVSQDYPDSIQLFHPVLGTGDIVRFSSFYNGTEMEPGKLGINVNKADEVVAVFTQIGGEGRAAKYSGGSWSDLGDPFPEGELGEYKLADNPNSTKTYVIYRGSSGEVGVKAYNYQPSLDGTPTTNELCLGAGTGTIIPLISINDSDKDSVYLRFKSSDDGVIPDANVFSSPISGYDFTSENQTFGITATPIGAGSTDITVMAIDGQDTLSSVYTITVNATPLFTPTGTDPFTCLGSDGQILVDDLDALVDYSIDYDLDGSPATTLSITTDGSGDYIISSLSAGNYDNWSITKTSTGCTGTNPTMVTLSDPSSPAYSVSGTDPTTCAGTDGEVNITGLLPSTTYDIDYDKDGTPVTTLTGSTTDASGEYTITGLNAANYDNWSITETATACTGFNPTNVTLTEPSSPTLGHSTGLTSDPTTCGGTEGQICLIGMSVFTTYDVTFDKDGIGDTFSGTTDGNGFLFMTGLSAGTYNNFEVTHTITLCSDTYTTDVVLSDPASPTFTGGGSTDPSTCGLADGTITVTGLSALYTYSVSYDIAGTGTVSAGSIAADGTGNLIITGLGAGTYDSVAVTDPATTCVGYEAAVTTFTLTDPSAPTFGVTVTSPTVCGASDGTITITGLTPSTTYTSIAFDLGGIPYSFTSAMTDPAGDFDAGTFPAGTLTGITVEDAVGCTGTDAGPYDLIDPAGPSVNAGLDITICEDVPLVLTADNPDDAVISWDNGVEDGVELMLSTGTYMITATATTGYCSVTDTMTLTVLDKPDISLATTLTTCGADDGEIDATITGGLAPYEIYWSNGETTEDIIDLAPTAYYINVVDDNGCYSMAVAAIELISVTLSGTETHVSCPGGDDGEIDLFAGGGGTYSYYWSNGERTQDLTGLTAGQYEVFVEDDAGCLSTSSFIITEPDPLKSTFVTVDATCATADGSATATVIGGTSPYSYAWEDVAGTPVGTDDPTLSGIEAGSYSLTVTDANLCSETFYVGISDDNGPVINIESITPATCAADGAIDITAIPEGTALVDSYSWKSGETTEDIGSKAGGEYSVEVMDDAGCLSAKSIVIPNVKPDVQEICIVTVDTATNTNRIVWTKPVTTEIDHYDIYRESSVADMFQLVNSQDYAEESFFVDSIAYPQLRSWRYKMVAVNNCGIESDMSIEHKTVHIVYEETSPGSFTLNWDAYEGFAYSEYNIWRYLPASGWTFVGSQSTALPPTFFDTPPSTAGIDYIIEVIPPATCTSTEATDHNSSRSNKTSHTPINPGDGVGTDDLSIDEESLNINVYPNPTDSQFNIEIQEGTFVQSVRVMNLSGQTVYQTTENNSLYTINLSDFESGIFILEIVTDKGTNIQKIVKG
ncbi:MAG: T9SS type A sorting domain-containing protein [Crocinitomicaceae bacterium]|nr:T9SS type A sorting domain-containing protein [Crocinitomicaceae bacterium]